MADLNGFTNTSGTEVTRGSRRSESTDPITLGDAMQMDLEDAAAMRFDELQGTSYIYKNGFNNKFGRSIARS